MSLKSHKHLVKTKKSTPPKKSINNIQRNAQIFQYTVLYSKHYGTNRFRSFMDNLQGGTTSIYDVQNLTKMKLN
jgi:hypothetical protein